MTVNVGVLVERTKAFSKKYGVPITKNQFEGTLDDPVPELPYMVWLSSHETGRGADGFNNLKAQDVDFELYTKQDNQEREDWQKHLKRKCCRTWNMTYWLHLSRTRNVSKRRMKSEGY